MKILIIGGGNMGSTYAQSFTAAHTVRKGDLYLLERTPEAVEKLHKQGFTQVFAEPGDYIKQMALVILAIKPQDSAALYPVIAPYISANQVVLSIMAGVTMHTLQVHLPTRKIVRAMPNLPAQIGMGMTGFTSADEVTKAELFDIQNLLNTTGKSLYFDQESQLDAVTAVSGSGPAYVYYVMDAMMQAARDMGFSRAQAELLVVQTFIGAIHLLNNHSYSCREWIAKVASKGGTTEAAIRAFDQQNVPAGIAEGLRAALRRAEELGK